MIRVMFRAWYRGRLVETGLHVLDARDVTPVVRSLQRLGFEAVTAVMP